MASNLQDMNWDQVQADPRYTSANSAQKANIENKWKSLQPAQPAAPAEQQSSGLAEDIGNSLVAGAKGAAAGISHGVASGLAGIVGAADKAAGAITGQGPSILSTYAKRAADNADAAYQRHMQEAAAGGHETAAKVGEMVGQTGADIGAMVAAPEAAIPAIAGREFGKAYNESGDLAGAAAVGGANYLAGRILPGATSEVAEGLINRGIAAAKNIGENALAGAKGGAIVGGAEAANQKDATAGKVIGGMITGGGTGAAFGAGIGAAHTAVGEVASRLSNKTADAVKDVVTNDVPPEAAPDINTQATTVTNAQTPTERADALKNAGQYRAVKGSAALEARGVPLLDSRLGYSPEAMAAHGKTLEDVQTSRDVSREGATNAMLPFGLTNSEAPGKMAVAKSEIEKGGKQLVDDVRGSLDSVKDSVTNFKNQVQEDFASRASEATVAEKQANTELMSAVNKFQKDHSAWQSALTNKSSGESVRDDNILTLAARAEESYNALPDYVKKQIDTDHQDMGEGFTKGYAPVENSATYIDAFDQLKSMHPSFRNATTAPSQGAVKGTPQPSVLGMAKASLDALGAHKARSRMITEQETNAAQARQLAAGLANAERQSRVNVDETRTAAMDETPPDDGTSSQMEYSDEAAPAPAPQPDQGIVRSPRQPVRPEPEPVAEPEPTPEPEPAPQPDMSMARAPARPEAPVEETPAPVEEPAPQPDTTLARTPKQPEQAPVEEPAPEATPEPSPEPQPEPEPLPAAKPKARQKPAEEAPEPTPETSNVDAKEAGTLETHRAKIKEKAINIVKKMFATKKVQDKVNEDNYNNANVIQRLKREDVSENTEALEHAQQQTNIAKTKREAQTHKDNLEKLEAWSKRTGIDQKYIDEAIKQKGLQASNILGVNDIQVRATKAWQRDLEKAKLDAQPKEEKITKEIEPWTAQRDKFYEEVTKMHPDVRVKAMQMIDNAFKASAKTEKPLTDSDVHGLWNKIYNHEAEVHTKAAREAEAAQANAKKERLAAEEANAADLKAQHEERTAKQKAENAKLANHQKLQDQMEDIRSKMVEKLKGKKIPESEINEFVDSHMDDKFGGLETPLSDVRFNSSRSNAAELADKFADKYHKSNAAEIEEMKAGKETEETKTAKEVYKEVKEAVGGSTVDKQEVENHLAEELIDRSEAAFREGNDVAAVEKASRDLMKAYNMDPTAATSIRQYPKVIAKASRYREEFPDNPEVWLSQTDVDSLAKAGRVNADGMKAKITDTVIGKRYDSVKLLTDKERDAVVAKLRAGEKVSVKLDKGRRGILTEAAGEAKPKATIKKPVKAQATPEQQALKNQKAKVARMQKKLNDDSYWARNDDEYGRKWKQYQAEFKAEQAKLQKMKK